MANRSTKSVLSARISSKACELLRIIRDNSDESIPLILERALASIATPAQIGAAEEAAAAIDRAARINRAAEDFKSRLSSEEEVKAAMALLSRSAA